MPYYLDDEDDEDDGRIANQRARLSQARLDRQELRELFDTPLGQRVLARLEARFEIDLPVFQGKIGQYDALDAMRRDAHREVFLLIHRQLLLAQQEATKNNNNV